MPRDFTITGYTFKELIELEEKARKQDKTDPIIKVRAKAVDRVRSWLCDAQDDNNWHDDILETWKQALDQIGFIDAKINYSGFCSQGDGASFTSGVDVQALVGFMTTPIEGTEVIPCPDGKEFFPPWIVHKIGGKVTDLRYSRILWAINHIDAKVERTSSNYCHSNTCHFKADYYHTHKPRKHFDVLFDDWIKDVEELRRDLCKAIYNDLETEYNWRNEDEQLMELAEANDWHFTASGKYIGG